jgi:DNA-binding XRE family transcriptional regulator
MSGYPVIFGGVVDVPHIRTIRVEAKMSENPDNAEWLIRDPAMLGQAIRTYRKQAGLDQQELATAAGINRTYLVDLERGNATEQTDRLFRVLRRLGVDVVLRNPRAS